jgi:hypothetical protein
MLALGGVVLVEWAVSVSTLPQLRLAQRRGMP